jgi:large subunit ribosomal protein L29
MRASELRELDDDELSLQLETARKELLNLRFQLATGQLDNVSRIPQVRKDIARVLTEMRSRELAAYRSQTAHEGHVAHATVHVSQEPEEELPGGDGSDEDEAVEDVGSRGDSDGGQASSSEVQSIAVGEEE